MSGKRRPQLTMSMMGVQPPLQPQIDHSILPSVGKIKITGHEEVDFTADDLLDQGEIGRGAYGTVSRMIHIPTNFQVAVKMIRSTMDRREQELMIKELKIVANTDCEYIAQSFGALFKEGACWICMELMDASLDKMYRFVYHHIEERFPECIIAQIALSTVLALDYLKEKLQMMHRDVKPSNILIDRLGRIKLCDFGIAGKLVDSIARTRDAGCQPYMAPERVEPNGSQHGYDIRSDVWSLGITLYELCTGRFPYSIEEWTTPFSQLQQVVNGEAPCLTESEGFSEECCFFVNSCLHKDFKKRPKYKALLQLNFIKKATCERPEGSQLNVAEYFCSILDRVPNGLPLSTFLTNS